MGLFFVDKHEKLTKAMHRACERSNAAKLQAALSGGADVNAVAWGMTALARAASKGFVEGVRILLEKKADPNIKDDEGETALIKAVNENAPEITKLLLDNGADVNAARRDGRTALHLAAQYGRGDLVKMLLAKGADPKAADNRMNTPADMARSYYSRIADLISSHEKREPATRPAPAVAPAPLPATGGWRLTAKDEVSNVTEKPEIGYRLTEIFNFGAGIYTRIARNMQTGAESQSLKFFDEFADRAALDRAQEALVRLGGEAPAAKPAKPSLAARPQGGNP